MKSTISSLPSYLKRYCVEQDYSTYTPLEQASWRYIMRQNLSFFKDHAVKIYLEGLSKTGIPINHIPRIREMDEKLQKLSWGAVPVSGFIPPAAFLEFQALGILAIACEMRNIENLEYTPSPDIVHEAAGHAPIIAHPEYAAYLKRYAQMAKKAIFSKEDIELYESIRYLSDIKEKPDISLTRIREAEKNFQEISKNMPYVSEAAKVSRMAWWTVEYGLLKENSQQRIYGAGLLSSISEGQNYLSKEVRKIPLSANCVNQSFDITKPQPQLFIAKNLKHLALVLEDFEKTLSYKRGGIFGLKQALKSKTVNTVILDSGIGISGELKAFELDTKEELSFIKFTGPVQLSYEGKQILGHGCERHPEGFSSPIGYLKAFEKKAFSISNEDLNKLGIKRGTHCKLELANSFIVEGFVKNWKSRYEKLLYITWQDCTVKKDGKEYFNPSWGEFDMLIGNNVDSVHGGPVDRESYGEYNVGSVSPKIVKSSYTDTEKHLFSLYEEIRKLREQKNNKIEKQLESIAKNLLEKHPKAWLASLEVLELVKQKLRKDINSYPWMKDIDAHILSNKKAFPLETQKLIEKGISTADREIN